jgi:hypothetical protein
MRRTATVFLCGLLFIFALAALPAQAQDRHWQNGAVWQPQVTYAPPQPAYPPPAFQRPPATYCPPPAPWRQPVACPPSPVCPQPVLVQPPMFRHPPAPAFSWSGHGWSTPHGWAPRPSHQAGFREGFRAGHTEGVNAWR